jgi:hypothetical protein
MAADEGGLPPFLTMAVEAIVFHSVTTLPAGKRVTAVKSKRVGLRIFS